MEKILEILINGFAMGAIYSLLALGFVLIFKSTGILNFAQGELSMVGAFIFFSFSMLFEIPYIAAFFISLALGAILGMVIDALLFRKMAGEPVFSTIMMTVGLASILTCIAGLIWGHDVHAIRSPFSDKTVAIAGTVLSQSALYTIGVSLLLFVLFALFFNHSLLGIAMKATAEDPDTSGLMGIDVNRVYMISWAIGSLVAVVAGIFLAEQSFVRLAMSHTGMKAMAAAILGGMESVGGVIVAGAIIGVVEGFAASYLSGTELGNFHFGDIKDVTAFAIMIIVLMIRPHGIFGREKVERV